MNAKITYDLTLRNKDLFIPDNFEVTLCEAAKLAWQYIISKSELLGVQLVIIKFYCEKYRADEDNTLDNLIVQFEIPFKIKLVGKSVDLSSFIRLFVHNNTFYPGIREESIQLFNINNGGWGGIKLENKTPEALAAMLIKGIHWTNSAYLSELESDVKKLTPLVKNQETFYRQLKQDILNKH